MVWNAAKAGSTGSNTLPLGPRKRTFNHEGEPEEQRGRTMDLGDRAYSRFQDASAAPSSSQSSQSPHTNHSGSPASAGYTPHEEVRSANSTEEPKRKRRSRWAAEEEKVHIPGMPTALPTNMTEEQLELFLLHTRIEEISKKLKSGDVLPPPDRERSPSPQPEYNAEGKRINTREYRWRKKLEDERRHLIEGAIKKYPDFKPPADYRKPTKLQEKVYIPAKEFPEINFIGLLIGPRGNTLKKMEADSGAKISIRGRGSVKEGKSRSDSASSANQEEDLHCLVSADTEEKIAKAIELINKIIETSASVPEGQNELKRMQLRELASLNGTLRDDENQTCLNCGALGHRRYECPEIRNVTISLVCNICGGQGHASRDCRERNNPEARERNQKIDSEFLNLMAELGETVPQPPPAPSQGHPPPSDYGSGRERDYGSGRSGHYGPPRGGHSSGGPPPWARDRERDRERDRDHDRDRDRGGRDYGRDREHEGSAPPPWAARGSHGSSHGSSHGHSGGESGAPPPWHQGSSSSGGHPWSQPPAASQPPPPPPSGYPAGGAGAPPPPPPPSAAAYGGYYPYNAYGGYYAGYGAAPPMAPWAQPGANAPPPPPSMPGQAGSGGNGEAPPPPPPTSA
ncbi:hypothetical protein DFQ26_007707 [Actinomortierella ambigua]|nr:hypothetical protein DFQ26_007707 [Actinomortierella ambigua]